MRRNRFLSAALFVSFQLAGAAAARADGFVVDHTTLHLFDQIPDQYLEAARNLRVLFMNRSVGVNTHSALNCFTANSYGATPVTCRRDFQFIDGAWITIGRNQASFDNGEVPAYIRFNPSPVRYNRDNWDFYIFADSWQTMAEDFSEGLHNGSIPASTHDTSQPVAINPLDYDVVSFQFSYLNVQPGDTIADPVNGFFANRPGQYGDVYDMEREIADHLTSATPRRTFVYFTSSLARGIGTPESTNFNEQMRQWCRANGKVLFDFADIESHDMHGAPCVDNRDGVAYGGENHPDDGVELPAICQEKTSEFDGGHLSTAQGNISVAKGFWITMAMIAGWNPTPGANQAPTVSAGPDRAVTLPAAASLSGTATDDGLPNPPGALTLTWSKVSGPGTVTFTSPNAATTQATFSSDGSYVLRLTGQDGALTDQDDVSVTVSSAANPPPARPQRLRKRAQ